MQDMYVRFFFFGKKINGIFFSKEDFQGTAPISVCWCEHAQSNRTTSHRNEFFIRFKEEMHWRKENDILEHSLALCQLCRRTPTVYKLMKATILLQTKRMHSISERRKIQNSWTGKFIEYFFLFQRNWKDSPRTWIRKILNIVYIDVHSCQRKLFK